MATGGISLTWSVPDQNDHNPDHDHNHQNHDYHDDQVIVVASLLDLGLESVDGISVLRGMRLVSSLHFGCDDDYEL